MQGCHNHTGPACSSSPHVPQVGVHKAFSKTTSHCFFNFPHACMHAQLLIHVRLSVTPWAVAHQAPLSMEFSRQEYWSGLPFPTPGDLPHPGTESKSLASPALVGRFFTTAPPGKPLSCPQAQLNFIRESTPLQFSSVQSPSRVQLFATP